MKVKFGSIVTDGRNKLGGHVYSKNHYGNFARTNTNPSLVQNDYTQPVRNNFLDLITEYSALPPASRSSWQMGVVDYPRTNQFGDTYYPTGQTLYTWLNRNRYTIGLTSLTNCPTAVHPTTDLTHTLTIGSDLTTLTINFPTPLTDADCTLVIMATRPLNPGRNYISTETRIIGTYDLSTTGSIDISTMWADKFGTVTPEMKIFTKLYLINKSCGLAGVEFFADAIAGPALTGTSLVLRGGDFVELVLVGTPGANVFITWGDGDTETAVLTGGSDVIPHAYPTGSDYTASLVGDDSWGLFIFDISYPDQFGNVLSWDSLCLGAAFGYSDFLTTIADPPATVTALLIDTCINMGPLNLVDGILQLYFNRTYLSTSFPLVSTLTDVNLGENTLPVSAVNDFLISMDSFATSGGTFEISHQSPLAAPTGAGATAASNLTGRGWSVATD